MKHIKSIFPIFFLLFSILFFHFIPMALRWPVRILFYIILMFLVLQFFKFCKSTFQRKNAFLFFIIVMVFNLAIIELLSVISIKFLEKKEPNYFKSVFKPNDNFLKQIKEIIKNNGKRYKISRNLGWDLPPNKSNSKKDKSNSAGLRGEREYSLKKPNNIKQRFLCFGDSYTYGSEVSDGEVWTVVAENLDKETEFLNFGIPGYGITQSYLRYKEIGKSYEADHVIISIISQNMRRNLNVFRPFIYGNFSNSALSKPYSIYSEEKGLEIFPNPLPTIDDYKNFYNKPEETLERLASLDYFSKGLLKQPKSFVPNSIKLFFYVLRKYSFIRTNIENLFIILNNKFFRINKNDAIKEQLSQFNDDNSHVRFPFSHNSILFKTQVALFKKMHSDVMTTPMTFSVLFFPTRKEVKYFNKTGKAYYGPLIKKLRKYDIKCIDALIWLKKHYGGKLDEKKIFKKTHYSEEVNEIIAKNILIEYKN